MVSALKTAVFGLRARLALLSALVITAAVLLLVSLVISLFSAGLREGTDQLLYEDAESLYGLLLLRDDGAVELFTLGTTELGEDELTKSIRFQVKDTDGHVLLSSPALAGVTLPAPRAEPSAPYLADTVLNNERLRIRETVRDLVNGERSRRIVIQVLRSIQPFVQQERRLQALLLWLLPLPIVLVALGSWLVATRSLRPIRRMVTTVQEMGGHDIGRRLPVKLHDEVGQLAITFNHLLDRLEQNFRSLERFTADASHELRSPLTALRTQAEVALSQPRSAGEYREAIGGMLEELLRIERMLDTLLQLARGDAGIVSPAYQQLDLTRVLADWVERYSALADDKGLSLTLAEGAPVAVEADPALLDRAVANLLDNAIQYTPRGGAVTLSATHTATDTQFRLCDTGPGIPATERERVFQRFVRLDTARPRAQGAGLGLAIVEWAVELHGGRIDIESNAPRGVCFVVHFPRHIPAPT